MNALFDGRGNWIGGAELAVLPSHGRPDFVADLGRVISSYSAVTGRYELCGLADYFGERGVETS